LVSLLGKTAARRLKKRAQGHSSHIIERSGSKEKRAINMETAAAGENEAELRQR